jgi:rubrerythrin
MQLAESTDNKLAVEVLKDITDEERVHVGEFLRLLHRGGKMMSNDKIEKASPNVQPSLPYADNALDPVISANTIGFHYGKHH